MTESSVTMSSAARELEERRKELATCMAELEDAQTTALADDALASKVLTVTVQEIYGDIAVDRVAVRADREATQEKVVVEGIPCDFTLAAGTDAFELVLMAEHAPTSSDAVGDVTSSGKTVGEALTSSNTLGEAPSSSDAVGEMATPAASPVPAEKEGDAAGEDDRDAETGPEEEQAAATTEPQQETEGDGVLVSAAEQAPAPASEGETEEETAVVMEAETVADGAEQPRAVEIEETENPVAVSGADEIDKTEAQVEAPPQVVSEVVGDEEAPQTGEAVLQDATEVVEDATEVVENVVQVAEDVTAPAVDAADVMADTAEAAVDAAIPVAEGGETVVEKEEIVETSEVTDDTVMPVPAVVKETLGCSTVTTEVVVPSTELELGSVAGQWRYLEVNSTPGDSDDEPVEVKTGVRFSTSLETQGGGDSAATDGRILELSIRYDEAHARVRAAEAKVEQLQPAAAASNDRRQAGAAGGATRKSAMKKGGKRKQDTSRSATARGGAIATLSAGFGKVYSKAKPVVALAWGTRNLFFFVSAVAAMHYHGEYLSV